MTDSAPAGAPGISLVAWAELLLLGALWGGSFFFARIAVAEIPPLTLVLYRVTLAAACLLAAVAVLNPSALGKARPFWRQFIVLSILNNLIPFTLIFTGQTAIGAGLASVMNATTPFWTALLANWLTSDDRLSTHRLAGILVGIGGAVVMIVPGLASGIGGPAWAKLAVVGAAISYGFAAIYARRFRGLPAPAIATGQLSASTVLMIGLTSVTGGFLPPGPVSAGAWACVGALAVAATAFAYILYFDILKRAGATNTSLVTLLVPVSAILLGAIFLGEHMEWFEWAGMAIILAGLVLIDGRLVASLRPRLANTAQP